MKLNKKQHEVFEKFCEPLMEWLKNNHKPFTKLIITSANADLVEIAEIRKPKTYKVYEYFIEKDRKQKERDKIMLIDEEKTIIKKVYPDWITDRSPSNEELIWSDDEKALKGIFLISYGKNLRVETFVCFPKVRDASKAKVTSKNWFEGFWRNSLSDFKPDGWMILPKPI